MEVNIFNVVKRIVMTPRSGELFTKQGKLTLEVAKDANKVMVKQAVEKIWDVKVDAVNVINTPYKKKRFGRNSFIRNGIKKAIVTLKKGYSIELPGQIEPTSVTQSTPEEGGQ